MHMGTQIRKIVYACFMLNRLIREILYILLLTGLKLHLLSSYRFVMTLQSFKSLVFKF